MNILPRLTIIAAGALCSLAWAAPARSQDFDPIVERISGILDRHPLVGIGEHHRQREVHQLYQALLKDPRVLCKVDDIAVEFGNSALQSVADRYVSGAPMSDTEKRSIWRDTGQWMVWDSPLYEEFFDTAREVNQRKLCPKPVRILLADPPIDWSRVHKAADYLPYRIRDKFFAEVVEKEVLAKGRKALLIAGDTHLWQALPAGTAENPTMGMLLERRHPGALVSLTYLPDEEGDRDGLIGPAPTLLMVGGTDLGKRDFGQLTPDGTPIDMLVDGVKTAVPMRSVAWPRVEQVVDGFLNLGPPQLVESDPATYREPVYQAELRRRAPILKDVHGIDFLAFLEEELAKPAK